MLKTVLVVVGFVLMSSGICSGQEEEIKFEEGVAFITLTRKPELVKNLPANITVITQKKIAQSNAQTIVELLSMEKGIVGRDYWGFGTKAEVDMKGFGETGASNCLVLINGRRINEIDLSNVDWTQIPLDQVERIEIVHNSGSVLYGDNAVGGVINIITKKLEYIPSLKASMQIGSFYTQRASLDLTEIITNYPINFRTSIFQSDGFRKNNKFDSYDVRLHSDINFLKKIFLGLEMQYHQGKYGLPGSITQLDWEKNDLQKTYTPDNNADNVHISIQSVLEG
ncbi:MAG: TonB-dependent receptor plug domain-containing protein, partial [Elusimicrobiota bacterium]|nr:TonB-dependent receptor plug domain-containing protein [Elusimicrobiota bacterium]